MRKRSCPAPGQSSEAPGTHRAHAEDLQSGQRAVGCRGASCTLQQGPPGAEHCPAPRSGQLHPRGQLSPGRAASSPGAGCLGGAGRRSPLSLDHRRETRRRRMLEEGLQLPGGAARPRREGLLPLCSPSSCQPGAGTWRGASQGTGADSLSPGGRAQPQHPR